MVRALSPSPPGSPVSDFDENSWDQYEGSSSHHDDSDVEKRTLRRRRHSLSSQSPPAKRDKKVSQEELQKVYQQFQDGADEEFSGDEEDLNFDNFKG